MVVRAYRMTIASVWYDEDAECVKEYEMHYKAAQGGAIRETRVYLAKRCVPHFQQTIYRKFKRWIPKGKIRVNFEREQPTLNAQEVISIESRRMEGTGKRQRWTAYPLPSKVLTYEKRTRKFKHR
jgi:hypothetical protein